MLTWQDRPLRDLLGDFGLDEAAEAPFPHDGWSGSTFTRLRSADGSPFVLKRTSPRLDWIVRATRDESLREAWAATTVGPAIVPPGLVALPYHGAAADGEGAAILMPDLSAELIAWEPPAATGTIPVADLARVLDAVARLHALPWPARADPPPRPGPGPWCPLPERLLLTSRRTCLEMLPFGGAGARAAERLLAGWDAFDRTASPAARTLVRHLVADPAPLVDALARLPSAGIHGDLKLANLALLDGGVGFIDWQMVSVAPVAVELGWLAVSNSAVLPLGFDTLMARYVAALAGQAPDPHLVVGDWNAQLDLARIVGLLLRGWRKGLDAEAGAKLGSGVSGADDLAEWSTAAVNAAERRL